YSYNADRQLTHIARPDGKTINFGYDNAGRLGTLSIGSGQFSYAYSSTTGNLASITSPDGGTLSYVYDGSLLKSSTWSGTVSGSVSRTYDNNFRITSRSINGGNAIDFQYDNDSLLIGAGDMTLNRDPQNGLLTGTT